MSTPLLSVENFSLDYYRRGAVVPALRDVTLEINAGETLGLMGESGSGKSTLALSILRLIGEPQAKVTSGRIVLHQKNGSTNLLALPDQELRAIRGKCIGMIFQDPFTALNPVMRIDEQMREVLRAHQMPVTRETLLSALEAVQLDADRTLRAYPHQLSGGQRQRVMIAMAILTSPQLLLADEPTTALDVLVQAEILSLLFRLQKEMGMAMLFISHNLGLVGEHTSRIAVIKQGRIVEQGHTVDIFRQPQHPYTRELLNALPAMTRGEENRRPGGRVGN